MQPTADDGNYCIVRVKSHALIGHFQVTLRSFVGGPIETLLVLTCKHETPNSTDQ
jgi:hypothetical protein